MINNYGIKLYSFTIPIALMTDIVVLILYYIKVEVLVYNLCVCITLLLL